MSMIYGIVCLHYFFDFIVSFLFFYFFLILEIFFLFTLQGITELSEKALIESDVHLSSSSSSSQVDEKLRKNTQKSESKPKATKEEEVSTGQVANRVYWAWIRGGGGLPFAMFILFLLLSNGCVLGSGIWLGFWYVIGFFFFILCYLHSVT